MPTTESKNAARKSPRISSALFAALLLATMPKLALADSYCGPGRRVGAENDGPGMSWKCVPDRRQSRQSSSAVNTGGNRAAAAANVAVGVLGLIGALATALEATDNVGQAEIDRAGHGTRSRELNRQAFVAMQAGDFLQAHYKFEAAAKEAHAAGNWKEGQTNTKNAGIAMAQNRLKLGIEAEQSGDLKKANGFYLKAKLTASYAGEQELAAQIAQYNDKLLKRAKAAGEADLGDTHSRCGYINRVWVCQ